MIVTQARELMARGHDVRAFSTPPPPPGFRKTVLRFCTSEVGPKRAKLGASFFDGSGVPHTMLPKFRPIANRDLPDADVVIATWWQTAQWVWRLATAKGRKGVFHPASRNVGRQSRGRGSKRGGSRCIRSLFPNGWQNLARDKFGDPDVSLCPQQRGYEAIQRPAALPPESADLGLLYNPIWFKGCEMALKAIEQVQQEIPNLAARRLRSNSPRGIITRCRRARNT